MPSSLTAEVEAAVRQVLPIAVAMLPINAAVYVFDGIITGAADFRFMAGRWLGGSVVGLGSVGVEGDWVGQHHWCCQLQIHGL